MLTLSDINMNITGQPLDIDTCCGITDAGPLTAGCYGYNLLKSQCSSEESGDCKGGETSPTTRLETEEVNFTSVRWSSRRVKLACYTAMRCDVLHMQCMSDVFVLYIRTNAGSMNKCVKNRQAYLPIHSIILSEHRITILYYVRKVNWRVACSL